MDANERRSRLQFRNYVLTLIVGIQAVLLVLAAIAGWETKGQLSEYRQAVATATEQLDRIAELVDEIKECERKPAVELVADRVSSVGVPVDVDRAMMLDSTRSIPIEMPTSSPMQAY